MNGYPSEKIAALSREAEAHDQEAIAEIENAQLADRDGGKFITPIEASQIRMRVLKSAILDHEAASIAERAHPASDPLSATNSHPALRAVALRADSKTLTTW